MDLGLETRQGKLVMFLYASGSVRNEIDQLNHGQLSKINLDTGEIIKTIPVFPTAFCARNGNPRGGTRGWRGLEFQPDIHNGIIAANNDSLVYFDYDLNLQKIVTHPSFGNLHGLFYDETQKNLIITSTLNDTYSIYDDNSIKVIEPLQRKDIYNLAKDWLKIRTRDRKPYDVMRDYREEWIEDVLHLNYVIHTKERDLALFNSMNLLVQLYPEPEILWSAPIEKGLLEISRDEAGLECPHDLVIETDNTILINSSARQELYRFYLKEKKIELIYKINEENLEWNRGLFLTIGSLFIGTGSGIILEIDRQTMKEKQRFQAFNTERPCSTFGILVSQY